MKHLIIGAGPAGVTAAETLRKLDRDADIVLIGNEPEPPYSRMAIPYHLEGKIGENGTLLRDPEHFDRLGIVVEQQQVAALNGERRSIQLENGGSMDYDRALIACGASPVTPPIPGVDSPRVSNCWTLEDARRITAAASPGSRVLLIGAGFIGCIILESLVKRGVELTVVESGNRMVPRMLDETAGGLLEQWCVSQGVRVLTSTTVEAIEDGNTHARVRLSSGERIEADHVITATGVRPNVGWLEDSGIEIDHGILVDRHMRSSIEHVHAAGDIAQGLDFSTCNYSVQAIQPTATDHGRIAALNMSGRDVAHQGSLNMNILDTLGLISTSFGLWMGVEGGDSARLVNPDEFRYINLQFDGDRLVGASSLGLTEHVGVLRGLIESGIELGPWKQRLMDDPTRIMEAWIGATQTVGYHP
jgi:NADPH-dependent 2,4-dienoyl-CoA reductase/sulfur reductase-like enzyme